MARGQLNGGSHWGENDDDGPRCPHLCVIAYTPEFTYPPIVGVELVCSCCLNAWISDDPAAPLCTSCRTRLKAAA